LSSVHFKVAQVPGYHHDRPGIEQVSHQLALAVDVHELMPVAAMDLAGGMSDFANHDDQVFPHLAGQPASRPFVQPGECQLQILVNHLGPQPDQVTGQHRQPLGQGMARLQPQRLNHADKHAHQNVNTPVGQQLAFHHVIPGHSRQP
jgi:hypothetical protein